MTAPSMAEVLAEHAACTMVPGESWQFSCGITVRYAGGLSWVRREHVAQALAAAGFGHVASELDERFAESDHKAARYWRRLREAERRAAAAEAQVAAVRKVAASLDLTARSLTPCTGPDCAGCRLGKAVARLHYALDGEATP